MSKEKLRSEPYSKPPERVATYIIVGAIAVSLFIAACSTSQTPSGVPVLETVSGFFDQMHYRATMGAVVPTMDALGTEMAGQTAVTAPTQTAAMAETAQSVCAQVTEMFVRVTMQPEGLVETGVVRVNEVMTLMADAGQSCPTGTEVVPIATGTAMPGGG